MDIRNLLDALLEEQHVTRAGEGVGLTRSAMSDAPARLRRHHGDDLLVRRGNRLHLTGCHRAPVSLTLLLAHLRRPPRRTVRQRSSPRP